jgi:hypothetical protein
VGATFERRATIAAWWTAFMFFYVYADILGFFDPKAMRQVIEGNMGFFGPATDSLKLSVAVFLSIPPLMIPLSLVLTASRAQWTNIVIGVLYLLAALTTLTFPSSTHYKYFEILEAFCTVVIVRSAWTWRVHGGEAHTSEAASAPS